MRTHRRVTPRAARVLLHTLVLGGCGNAYAPSLSPPAVDDVAVVARDATSEITAPADAGVDVAIDLAAVVDDRAERDDTLAVDVFTADEPTVDVPMTPPDDGTGCPSGQSRCDGACVSLASDRAQCGACGNACAAGLACVGGACARVLVGLRDPPVDVSAYGDVRAGDELVDACPLGEVLTGLGGQYRDALVQLSGRCARLDVTGRAVTLTAGNVTPTRGALEGTPDAVQCPAGTVVVGYEGRAATQVNQLSLRCAPLTVTGDGPLAVAVGATVTARPFGGEGGAAQPGVSCPTGQVAAALRLRANDGIDSFRLQCRPLRAFGIMRGAALDTPLHGNRTGGVLTRDVCPEGRVLAGIDAQLAGYLVRTSVRCRALRGLDAFGPWSVTTGIGATLPERGSRTGVPVGSECAAGAAVTSVSGRAGLSVDGLRVACGALGFTTAGSLSIVPSVEAPFAGGSGGTAFAAESCPAGAVAIGANLRAGDAVDAFGLICAPLTAR